jgi:hypothetical protein
VKVVILRAGIKPGPVKPDNAGTFIMGFHLNIGNTGDFLLSG